MKQTRLISLILAIMLAVSAPAVSVTFAENGAAPEGTAEEGAVPASEAETDQDIPAEQEQEPAEEEQEPAGEEQEPAEEEQEPAEEEQEPAEEEQEPAEEEQQPAEEEQEPAEEEQPAEEVRFEKGYVYIAKNEKAYSDETRKKQLGTFTEKSAVYAETVRRAKDPAKDVLKITFDTQALRDSGSPLQTAYVYASCILPLTEKETRKLEAALDRDRESRKYGKQKIALAEFAPVGPDTETNIAVNGAVMTVKLSPSKALGLGFGETGTIRAKAVNADGAVAYQWEYSSDNGKTWKADPKEKSAVLQFSVTEKNYRKAYKFRFRCKVTDQNGTVTSSSVRIKAPFAVNVPDSVKGGLGEKVKLTAAVTGSLSGTPAYQWQVSTNGGTKWKNCTYSGNKTKTLTVKLTEKRYGFLYRCTVTADGQTMCSSTVSLETPYTVTTSPAKRTLGVGDTGLFRATVSGTEGTVSYQWQHSRDGGETWTNTTLAGSKKAALSVKVTNTRYGMMFRCMVTAGNGKVAGDPVWINPTDWKMFQYTDNGKGQWNISKYKQDATKVTVPAGFDGRPVVGIAAGVFKGKGIRTVVIPPSVTAIGASAFEDCSGLTAVTLSDNVRKIEKAAFKNCGKLANMKIENK